MSAELVRRNYASTAILIVLTVCAVAGAGVMNASPARADSWKVCNGSAQPVDITIAYSLNDARQYITKGWWTVAACGGCKTVFSGNLPIKGVFLHGEDKSGNQWAGTFSFCAKRTRFEMPNANVNQRTCNGRGGEVLDFAMHKITSANHTTTLDPPKTGPRCID
jgi:uncharacterized membrane protein